MLNNLSVHILDNLTDAYVQVKFNTISKIFTISSSIIN